MVVLDCGSIIFVWLVKAICFLIAVPIEVYVALFARLRFNLFEVSWNALAIRVIFAPNLLVGLHLAVCFVKWCFIIRCAIIYKPERDSPPVVRFINVFLVEVIDLGWLLNFVVLVVDHDHELHVAVANEDCKHEEAQDYATVGLQFGLAIFKEDLKVLIENVGLLDIVAEPARLLALNLGLGHLQMFCLF